MALIWSVAATPAAALDPTRPAQLYSLDFYRDGLPQYTVRTILQTSDGYLWLGTFEGLVRFDGVRFEVFGDSSVKQARSWKVGALCEHPRGTLWVGTSGGGLLRYRDGAFTTFGTGDGLPGTTIVGLVARRDGSFWVATEAGLTRWTGGRFEPVRVPSLSLVRAMVEGPDGSLYVGGDRELARLEEGRAGVAAVPIHLPSATGAPTVEALATARDGSILVCSTEDGFYRVRGGEVEHVDEGRGLPARLVKGALQDRDGSIWLATSPGGLARVRDGAVEVLDRRYGLPSSSLRSLAEDREGSLWIGTDRGLARLKDLKFVNYGVRQGLPEDNVRTVVEGPDGSLWVGIYGGGLVRVDLRTGLVEVPVDGLANTFVRTLAFARDGTLWVGTGSGLFRLANRRLAPVGEAEGLKGKKVDTLYARPDGSLLVVTSEGGLQGDRGGRFQAIPLGLSKEIRAILEDARGTLWLGTSESGLAEVRDGRLVRMWSSRDGLASDTVFALHEDARGDLWIGTHEGLSRLRAGRISSVRSVNGLLEDTIFQVLDDQRGSIWLTTNRGLIRADKASLEAVLDGRAARVEPEVFGKADGMGADQCNGNTQPAGIRTRDGRLAIPTAGGLTIVDPANLHRNGVPPPAVLTGFLVDGRPVSGDALSLPWSSDRFEMCYDGLSLLQPERVAFRYRVDGFDRDWVDAGSRRVAFYNSLPPGRHTFRVEARNNDGVWSAAAAAVSFDLPAPPWRRWWAYLAYAVAAGFVVAGSGRLYARILRRRNELLERKVQERTTELHETLQRLEVSEARAVEASRAKTVFLANMSHELRTPLNAVLGFAQLLERDPALTRRSREELGIIHRSGEHLLGLINDVLSLSKIEAGRLSRAERPFDVLEMLQAVQDIVRVRAEAKDLDLVFRVDPSVPGAVEGDEGKLRQVLINLLGNAVKFTEKGSVTLRASWKEGRARFEVEDTGPGISEEEIGRLFRPFSQTELGQRAQEGTGLGLVISRQIVELLGGEIGVRSRKGEGTTFSFEIALPASEEAVEPRRRRRVVGLVPGQAAARILAVDDTLENRLLLSRLLDGLGFEVREAANGAEALEEWERFRPHLVFMDMRMPVLDGREATRLIRQRERARGDGSPRTVIVSLTASAFEHEKSELLQGGADEVLTKPFRIDALLDLVARRLDLRYRYEDEEPAPAAAPSPGGSTAERPALPGIDVGTGLRRASGNASLYRRLLLGLLDELERLGPRLRELAASGATEELASLLHKVKGSAATLGAVRLARNAGEVEAALAKGRGQAAEVDLEDLLACLAEVALARQALERPPWSPAGAEGGGGDGATVLPIVRRLGTKLALNDLSAVDDVEELWDAAPSSLRERLRELQASMDRLDFGAAAEVLARIEAGLPSGR